MKSSNFLTFNRAAFARADLVAVLGALSLLGSVAWAQLSRQNAGTELIACRDNLRQIGRAFHIWASEHGDLNPWWRPAMQSSSGRYDPNWGTRRHPLDQNVWLHFSWVSNELRTPRILACPSDLRVRVASDFGDSAENGLLSPEFGNNAVSYVIALHSMADAPASLLSGDRNVAASGLGGVCATGIRGLVQWNRGGVVRWTNAIHGTTGNLLFTDGRVEQASDDDLLRAIGGAPNAYTENGEHVLVRR